jgi:ADP-heptose:LPS heptosyltransferase
MKIGDHILLLQKTGLKKVLFIRLSSIGDIVLTSPLLRCFKQQGGEVAIHFVVKKQFLPIISANPYIDKIYTLDDNLKEIAGQMKREHYDFIVDVHKNFRSYYLRYKLRRPVGSFPKLNMRKWLLVRFKMRIMPDVHIVDRYFKALEKLNIENDGKGLDYFIPEGDEVDVPALSSLSGDYTAFVIGAKHYTKTLPEEKILEVCTHARTPIILLGGPEDAEKGKRIATAAGKHVFNACGKLNINQSASVVQQAAKVITHDTGLMHIAAAFRKPILSIWGNTVPEFGMYPYLPGNEASSRIMQVEGLKCRPCSKIGYDRCPKGHFKCMQLIDEQEISGWIENSDSKNSLPA